MAEITADKLLTALQRWSGATPWRFQISAKDAAEWIQRYDLSLAIMPGVRPAKTFEAGFIEVFGQTLTGKPVKKRKRA